MFKLNDIFESVKAVSSTTPMVINKYPLVHFSDWEAVTVVNPSEHGPWIAGGSCLRWYQNLPVGESDIDVFCRNAKQASDVMDAIRATSRYHRKYESENATTFDVWSEDRSSRWTIQIITKRYYSDLKEVLDNFDLTVCQIGTDGNKWQLGNHTARDIREKNLRMCLPLQPDAAKRLTKYWVYGYRPVPGLLENIINNPIGNWKFNPEEDYT